MEPENTDKRLFLLDAYALIYRAYFALSRNPLINSKGMNVSAIMGFVNTLNDLMNREKPTHLGVVFDSAGKSAREEEHAFYKANREKMPEDIALSLPYIREILAAYHIPVLGVEGFEADDVIGTLAKKAEKEGYTTYMVTSDKDFAQLVSDNIFLYKPSRMGSAIEILGKEEILEKWSIQRPEQVIDILGLWGDSIDNIPGIPGIGEKTAKKLIAQYDSVEGIIENTDQLKGKQKENVIKFAEQGMISKKLATIVLDVPVEFEYKDLELNEPDKETLAKIFADLEFRTLGKRLLGDEFSVNKSSPGQADSGQMDLFQTPAANPEQGGKSAENTEHKYILLDQADARQTLLEKLKQTTRFAMKALASSADPTRTELIGIAIACKAHESFYIPLPHDRTNAGNILQEFKAVFEDPGIAKLGHNLKFDSILLKTYGIEMQGIADDTMIAHYLIEPDVRHSLDIIAENYLGYSLKQASELIGKGKSRMSWRQLELDAVKEFAAERPDICLQLEPALKEQLSARSVDSLYREVEIPLLNVLAEMEFEGVRIDGQFLRQYSIELEKEIAEVKAIVFDMAAEEFNLDSPKQLSHVLFEKMEIPFSGKKTKTGQFSTNEEVLQRLAVDYEIAGKILTYREISKLKSTYVDALPALINPQSGRIHTTFSQAVAATGRLSSNNPNLQNIPIRSKRGREIRKAFIPKSEEFLLLSADYSQVELRIIADISGDEGMLEAFQQGLDIHAATASKVYGVPLDKITAEMRRNAKTVNFGIIYGISAFGLSQRLRIARKEAAELIANYFEKYPKVKGYMDQMIESARSKGYVETILGRRRYLKDINSRNYTVRGHAERNAINAPIQGSAADMIKLAMIHIYREIEKRKLRSNMILQVHDELVFDVHREEVEELRSLVEDKMKHAIDLSVPIAVESGVGNNWLEAH